MQLWARRFEERRDELPGVVAECLRAADHTASGVKLMRSVPVGEDFLEAPRRGLGVERR
jgi:hypothetical protein